MSYEILREKPEYCLIPFGTGDLYINVLNIVKMEYFNSFVPTHDPRFFGDMKSLKQCHFFGASSRLVNTKMDKLYSSFLPSIDSFRKYINQLKNDYSCVGEQTGIYYIEENYVDEAIALADSRKLTYEPSGLAGLALLLQMRESFPKDANILIVNTGRTKELREMKK